MEHEPKGPSTFAYALLNSGIRFNLIADKERRLSKAAKRKAAAYYVAGVAMLGAASYTASPRLSHDIYQVSDVSGSIIVAGYSFYRARRQVQKSALYKQEIPNTLSLYQMAESARIARQ